MKLKRATLNNIHDFHPRISTTSLIELNSWFTKHKNCNRLKSRQLIVIWLKWIDSFQLKILADSVHTKMQFCKNCESFVENQAELVKELYFVFLEKLWSSRESKNSKNATILRFSRNLLFEYLNFTLLVKDWNGNIKTAHIDLM